MKFVWDIFRKKIRSNGRCLKKNKYPKLIYSFYTLSALFLHSFELSGQCEKFA
jgi:hypothetical protein